MGFRRLEAVITVLVGVVAACYLVEIVLARPAWPQVLLHAVVPSFAGTQSVLLATGILGATVMPHVIFLHSALTQGRIVTRDPQQMRRLFRYELVDVVLAMGLAGLINAAMLVMAAKTFHEAGLVHVDAIEKAYMTLEALLGRAANTVFAVSLLAAGLSSSAVGTMSGQVIMQGFLRRHVPVWVRRGVTMAPALAVIMAGIDPTRALVLSQVVLCFGLPFAPGAIDPVHAAAENHGSADESAPDHAAGLGDGRAGRGAQRLPAVPARVGGLEGVQAFAGSTGRLATGRGRAAGRGRAGREDRRPGDPAARAGAQRPAERARRDAPPDRRTGRALPGADRAGTFFRRN